MVGDNNQSNTKDTNSEIRKYYFIVQEKNEAAVRNRKILAAFNGDLGAEIAAHKEIPLKYRSYFRNTSALTKLFYYHKDKVKIIEIIQQGSCYNLDKINE